MTNENSVLATVLRAVVAVIIAAALWEFAARFVGMTMLMPDLPTTIGRAINLYAQAGFWTDVVTTVRRAGIGYGAAVIAGIPIGLALSGGKALRLLLGGLVGGLAAAPLIALAPLATLWFGVGEASKIAIAFVAAVFPLINRIVTGLTPPAPERESSMMRSVAAGLRVAVVPALGAVLVGEIVASTNGLGQMLMNASMSLDVARFVATFLVAALPGIVAVAILRSIEARAA